jgi:hypothetical protein
MKIFIIAIVMFFSDPNRPGWLNDSVEIGTAGGKQLFFKTEKECFTYVDKHLEGLKQFGKSRYPDAVAVKTIYCVERFKS